MSLLYVHSELIHSKFAFDALQLCNSLCIQGKSEHISSIMFVMISMASMNKEKDVSTCIGAESFQDSLVNTTATSHAELREEANVYQECLEGINYFVFGVLQLVHAAKL